MITTTAQDQNEYIATKIMGLVPCDQWMPINFGSAGGAALQKICTHDNCYPTQELGNINGKVGGVPDYQGNWTTWRQVEEKIVMDADLWHEFIRDLDIAHFRTSVVSTNLFAQCGLKTRVIALIAAHQKLYGQ